MWQKCRRLLKGDGEGEMNIAVDVLYAALVQRLIDARSVRHGNVLPIHVRI